MKLYLLSQNDNNDWDTFDSCLVCAESPEDALTIDPSGRPFKEDENYSSWAKKKSSITCREIGIANEDQKRGVIISSFNAG